MLAPDPLARESPADKIARLQRLRRRRRVRGQHHNDRSARRAAKQTPNLARVESFVRFLRAQFRVKVGLVRR
jgi:hypothetical protein